MLLLDLTTTRSKFHGMAYSSLHIKIVLNCTKLITMILSPVQKSCKSIGLLFYENGQIIYKSCKLIDLISSFMKMNYLSG